jgi:hypothetical protein
MPRETRRVFQLSLGRQFKVRARNPVGWLELHVGRVVGEKSYVHSIWIEPEYVRVVRRRAGRPAAAGAARGRSNRAR